MEEILAVLKQNLGKTKRVKNINFVLKDFDGYRQVPCLEFNLASKGYEAIIGRIQRQFCREIKKSHSDLTIVYETPNAEDYESTFRRIRVYIKNRDEQEKQKVLENILGRFNSKIEAYLRR